MAKVFPIDLETKQKPVGTDKILMADSEDAEVAKNITLEEVLNFVAEEAHVGGNDDIVYCDYSVHQRQIIRQGSDVFLTFTYTTPDINGFCDFRRAQIELCKGLHFERDTDEDWAIRVPDEMWEKLDHIFEKHDIDTYKVIIEANGIRNYGIACGTDRRSVYVKIFRNHKGYLYLAGENNGQYDVTFSNDDIVDYFGYYAPEGEKVRLYFCMTTQLLEEFFKDIQISTYFVLRWKKNWWYAENIKPNTEVRCRRNFATIIICNTPYKKGQLDVTFALTWRKLLAAPLKDINNYTVRYHLAKLGNRNATQKSRCHGQDKDLKCASRKVAYARSGKKVWAASTYYNINNNRKCHYEAIFYKEKYCRRNTPSGDDFKMRLISLYNKDKIKYRAGLVHLLRKKLSRPYLVSYGRELIVWNRIGAENVDNRYRPTGRIISIAETRYSGDDKWPLGT